MNNEHIEPNEDPIEKPGYRIVRCCGNCKFFWYFGAAYKRGNCRLGSDFARTRKSGERRTDITNREKWPRTDATCVCDHHIMKGRLWSITRVTDFCGAKFEDF